MARKTAKTRNRPSRSYQFVGTENPSSCVSVFNPPPPPPPRLTMSNSNKKIQASYLVPIYRGMVSIRMRNIINNRKRSIERERGSIVCRVAYHGGQRIAGYL